MSLEGEARCLAGVPGFQSGLINYKYWSNLFVSHIIPCLPLLTIVITLIYIIEDPFILSQHALCNNSRNCGHFDQHFRAGNAHSR